MTAQVSDVQITSKTMRRLTTVHGVVSFFFNVIVLALTVNIVSSLMSAVQHRHGYSGAACIALFGIFPINHPIAYSAECLKPPRGSNGGLHRPPHIVPANQTDL
jgi:hypothetical protein